MLKYTETEVVLKEVPDEITLAINISGCPCRCPGCHSPHLWEDIGEPLTEGVLEDLIRHNPGISCISLMGGDAEPEEVNRLLSYLRTHYPGIMRSWYSGMTVLSGKVDLSNLDYVKVGPYIREKGGLDHPGTNQKFYKVVNGKLTDITNRFQKT